MNVVTVDAGITPKHLCSKTVLAPFRRTRLLSSPILVMDASVLPEALKSCLWQLGRMSHPLRSGNARRFRAYTLLLTTTSFGLPPPRQHIQSITPGFGFLRDPTSIAIRVTPAQFPERTMLVTSFLLVVFRCRRVVLCTGCNGSEPWSRLQMPGPYPLPFWSSQ
jgi:hypothetical protein